MRSLERTPTVSAQDQASNPPSERPWFAPGVIAVFTILGVFVLPFFFPPAHPTLSSSYSSGYNNRVAAVAAAICAMATFGLAWRSGYGFALSTSSWGGRERIRSKSLGWALTACAMFTAGVGWLLTKSQVAYNDNIYFLEYMDEVSRYHLHVYKDFSFLYGPVLLYFPVAVQVLLRPLHAGVQAAYYMALTLMQLLGIVLLYYTLEALPLSRRLKTITLGLFTLGTLCPLMGLNYTLVRSLLPFSTLLFIIKVKRPFAVAGLIFLGELLQLSVSPELGVAFAAGACCYSLCRAFATSWLYFVALVAAPLGILAFLGVTGTVYLSSMSQFSSGCLNLIVEPLPYILFFLGTLVWLVPWMLGRMVKDGSPDTVEMLSLFVVSMTLVPAALGRCDPLHVFFNGAGVYLLGVVATSAYSSKVRDLWLLGLGLMLLWTQVVNSYIYVHAYLYAAKIVFLGAPEREKAWFQNFLAVEREVDRGKVSVPFYIPFSLEEELKRTGLYQPDRECFYIGIWDTASEAARARRMDETEWAIVSTHATVAVETSVTTRGFVGLGFKYRERHAPYRYGALLFDDLAVHWTRVSQNVDWILYHNNQFSRRGSGK